MKRRILIVEDELGFRRLLEYLLSQYYAVTALADGEEAVSWLEQGNEVDLVITDIEMPRMTGLEMVAHMRQLEEFENLPVILISSRDMAVMRPAIENLNVADCLRKPVQPKVLYWKVEEILQRTPLY